MENEKVVVLQLKLGRRHCLFALAFAFLCFHPRPLGSETLTLNTYYPAPYGGYVALLTTGGTAGTAGVNTLLARDAGNVGIGTGAAPFPNDKLSIMGVGGGTVDLSVNGQIRTGDAGGQGGVWLSDGNNMLVGQNGTNVGFWTAGPNGPDQTQWRLQVNQAGAVGVGTPLSGTDLAGDLRVAGTIRNVCESKSYLPNGVNVICPSGYRVMSFTGDGWPRVEGFMPANAASGSVGTYVVMGEDWGGTMICCRIDAPGGGSVVPPVVPPFVPPVTPPPPECLAAGSRCTANSQCCSQRCSRRVVFGRIRRCL